MKTLAALLCVFCAATASAGIHTDELTYKDGDTELRGFIAMQDDIATHLGVVKPQPAVLIVHQWMGLTDYEKGRARQLAELGYVVFALDIYGVDHRPANRGEAGAKAGKFKNDRELFRKRLNLGLDKLKNNNYCPIDPKRIVAIGYCFGGTGVLELARSGADIAGVVSFHGGLDAPTPEDAKNIKGKVLVLHGADDPFVPREGIDAMKQSFNDAKVDWQMIEYSGAVHAFTQPMAGDDPSKGAAYDKRADRRSWRHMRLFFNETIKPVKPAPEPE